MCLPPTTVAHLTQSLGWGGLERVVLDLCRDLDPARFRPLVVSLSPDLGRAEQFAAAGVPVAVVPQRGLDPTLPWRLAALFRARGVGLVQAHNFGRFFYGGPAARLAGLPSLYTEHSNTLPHERALLLAQPRLSRLAGRVVAVSDTVRYRLIVEHGLAADRVVTIPNGIDLEAFDPARQPGDARVRLGLPADAFVLGHAGRFVAVKNHAVLLRAFAVVRRQVPAAWLVLAGGGPLLAAMQQLAGELGVGDRVRFLGVREDLPAVLAALDVFVLSSDSEGLPLALLEAMAAGLPVVATEAAGKDVVESSFGCLTPTGEVAPLAAALAELAGDVDRRRRWGTAALAVAQRRYSLATMRAAYEQVYATLLG